MKLNILQKFFIFSFFILAGYGVIGYFVYTSHQKLLDSERGIQHCEQLINISGNLLSLVKDMETAARGFILTYDSVFLEPLYIAEKSSGLNIRKLRQLTQDEPTQLHRIDSLNFYVHKRLDFSFQTIELRRTKGLTPTIDLISTKYGKQLTDRIRMITEVFQHQEETVLKQQKQKNQHNETMFNRFLLAEYLLLAVFTVLILIFIRNNLLRNKERDKRAAELILANKELLFQNEEKEKRAEELIKAIEKAEESDNLKSAFLNNLSHEIRTPMNQILGFANFLKDPELLESQRNEYISIINSQSYQLLHIITEIVEISKITTRQVDLKISTFNLGEMMDELVASFKPKAEHRNLQLSLSKKIANANARIQGDQIKLESILSNLIENAIKYTETGGVQIEYSLARNKLIFTVKDTGIGIEEHEKQIIFDRFRQIEITMARKYGGLGLGLSITNAYVRMMSGEIRVESEPGNGSTFIVEIPYVPAIQDSGSIAKVVDIPVFSRPDWQNKTFLIVEDEESNMKFLKELLRPTGVNLLFASNGLEAVELCKIHPQIILVLMDIKMPRMDGLEATKLIKTFRSDLPVIATTAFAMTGEREYILEAGCDEYVAKPIIREELIAKIQKYIG